MSSTGREASIIRGCRWTIGSSEPTPHRFNGAMPLSGLVRYEIGVSDPATDWPRTSAGPLDDSTGYSGFTLEIGFDVDDDAEEAAHLLILRGSEGAGPLSPLVIEGDGWSARAIAHRERSDRRHAPLPPGPTAGVFSFELTIPAGRLRAGRNVLRVSPEPAPTHEDHGPGARKDRRSPGSWFGNTWRWHSVSLEPLATLPEPTLELSALPLRVRAAGAVRALVRMTARNLEDVSDNHVILTFGEQSFDLEDAVDASIGEFGDFGATFAVPDFDRPTEASATIGGVMTATVLTPARKWTVHVLPHVHLDLGYTDLQAKITEIHTANIDRARSIRADHPDYRYTLDGMYIADAYERTRTHGTVDMFRGEVRAGALGLNPFWANPLTGVCSREELVRGLYAGAAARRAGWAPMTSANITDVPTYTGSLPSILAGAGVRRFFGIANHMRGGNADSDVLHLMSPVRWRGPDGSEVFTFFVDAYTQLRTVCSDQPSLFGASRGLDAFLERYERVDYPHSDLPLFGTHADNEDVGSGYADLVERWNATYAWPRLRFSTLDDYFDAVEPTRDAAPVVTGDAGSYWEDGVGTVPQIHAGHRRLQAALPAAEALAGLVAFTSEHLRVDTEAFDRVWRGALVGGEHTMTASYGTDAPDAYGVAEQLAWKDRAVTQALGEVDELRLLAMAQLGDRIDVEVLPSVLVTNALSWPRSGVIELELPEKTSLRAPDGEPRPATVISEARDGRVQVAVDIGELPAFGYRTFEIAASDELPTVKREAIGDGDVVLGDYRLRLIDGRVRGAEHIPTGKNLLDARAKWALGEVFIATGGGTREGRGRDQERTSLWDYDPNLPPAVLTDVVAHVSNVEVATADGRVVAVHWNVDAEGALRGHATLACVGDQLELVLDMDKTPELAKQALYVAFPFDVGPGTRFDRQQGWWNPVDALPGAAHEWYAAQNAVVLGEGDEAISWMSRDAALVVFDEPVRGDWRTLHARRSGTLLSWVTNNYWFTNTPASQQGRLSCTYRFGRSAGPAEDLRRGWELRTELSVSTITVADRRDPWPRAGGSEGSLWSLSSIPPNVIISVFASRFHDDALLVRVHEIIGAAVQFDLEGPIASSSMRECSDVEDTLGFESTEGKSPRRVQLEPFQVRNFLMERSVP